MGSILPGSVDYGGDAYTREAYVEDENVRRPSSGLRVRAAARF
jgi:hypothetical protein